MPVPSSIDDLSTTAGSNSPAGSETPTEGDNYIRTHAAFIATLRDRLNGTSTYSPTFANVKLQNTTSADTATLDHYEEGSTNLSVIGSSIAGVASSYSSRAFAWQRVGNRVRGTCTIAWSGGHTGTGNVQISGFPYTASSIGGVFLGYTTVVANVKPLQQTVLESGTASSIVTYFDGTTGAQLAISSSGTIAFFIDYGV